MPFKLLSCDRDVLSLEFEVEDIDTVRICAARQFGGWAAEQAGMATLVSFGGEQFAFQNEWDDPCLISSTENGRAVLRRLHDELIMAGRSEANGASFG